MSLEEFQGGRLVRLGVLGKWGWHLYLSTEHLLTGVTSSGCFFHYDRH